MRVLNCVIVEDEQPALEVFQSYVQNYKMLELKASFTGIPAFQEYMASHLVDVLFLDIQLPGLSGMDFLSSVKIKPLVVITSAYSEHAVKAFEVKVFDYLLKPYSPARFSQTVQRIIEHYKNENGEGQTPVREISIKSSVNRYKVNIEEILFIESQREYMVFKMESGKEIRSRMTISECLKMLPNEEFMRVHRSFLINTKHIESATADYVDIHGVHIPIGDHYKLTFREFWEK